MSLFEYMYYSGYIWSLWYAGWDMTTKNQVLPLPDFTRGRLLLATSDLSCPVSWRGLTKEIGWKSHDQLVQNDLIHQCTLTSRTPSSVFNSINHVKMFKWSNIIPRAELYVQCLYLWQMTYDYFFYSCYSRIFSVFKTVDTWMGSWVLLSTDYTDYRLIHGCYFLYDCVSISNTT